MSPKSEHSVWGASSSDSDLRSLATRLRTTSSAKYSQDGMSAYSHSASRLLCTEVSVSLQPCIKLLDCVASVNSSGL